MSGRMENPGYPCARSATVSSRSARPAISKAAGCTRSRSKCHRTCQPRSMRASRALSLT